MRLLLIVVGIFGLVHLGYAQSMGYSSAGSDSGILQCSLKRAIEPSKESAEMLKGQGTTYACAYGKTRYEASFVGVDFGLAAAKEMNSSLVLSIRCTAKQPTGAYYFGGYPVGFHTSSFQDTPWFYNPNPKMPGGRCFIVGDAILMKQMKAVKNKSAMVILPIASTLN